METIGPEGGVVEVADPESPIYGTRLEIASGDLYENVNITINEVTDLPLPHQILLFCDVFRLTHEPLLATHF